MNRKQLAQLRKLAQIAGREGGRKAAKNMTPEQRQERAKKAVVAREAKRRVQKGWQSGESVKE